MKHLVLSLLFFMLVLPVSAKKKPELSAQFIGATTDSIYIMLENNTENDIWLFTSYCDKFIKKQGTGLDQMILLHQMDGQLSLRFVPINPLMSVIFCGDPRYCSLREPELIGTPSDFSPSYHFTCIPDDDFIIYPISTESLNSGTFIYDFDNRNYGLRRDPTNLPVIKLYPYKQTGGYRTLEFAYWTNPESILKYARLKDPEYDGGFVTFGDYANEESLIHEIDNYKVLRIEVPVLMFFNR